nr:hypothetical protein [Pseudoxanthomonas indica]
MAARQRQALQRCLAGELDVLVAGIGRLADDHGDVGVRQAEELMQHEGGTRIHGQRIQGGPEFNPHPFGR